MGYEPGTTFVGLQPSNDPSGVTDSRNVTGLQNLTGQATLLGGQWYLSNVSITRNALKLQGIGSGTVINVLAGQTGFIINNVAQLELSDMAFSLAASSLAIQVNGAEDSNFHDLWLTGSTASGGISINGDDLTEQTYRDIWMRNVGGANFSYTRTTATDTGGLYLSRIRLGAAPSGATGFSFVSTAGSATPVNIWSWNCSADGYYNDAWLFSNVQQVAVFEIWGTMNASANTGKVPLHITGGLNLRFIGGFLYQSLGAGTCALLDGNADFAYFDGGLVLTGGTYAFGLVSAFGCIIGDNVLNSGNTVSDAAYVAAANSKSAPRSPVTYVTQNGAIFSLGIDAAGNLGNQVWLYNTLGTLVFENTGFTTTLAQLDQSGNWTTTGVSHQNGGTDTSGTATASSPSFTSGTAIQLSTTRDVILYIAIQTSAALAVAIGPTSTPANTIMPSQSYALGMQTIRVPKGWYVKITGTIADLTITAVTC